MAKSSLTVFDFKSQQVRVIKIDNEPWFVAKDLCVILEIKNVSDALTRLDDDEKGIALIDTLGGKQEMAVVSESGMYALVMSSRKSQAKPFRKWVTSEVLTSIRKKGYYSTDGSLPGEPYWYKRLKQFNEETNIPDGYFCIFKETLGIVGQLEAKGYTLPDTITPDISIGKHWVNYLRRQGINPDDISVKYSYRYPNQKYPVSPRAYNEDYLPKFRKWFRSEYKPVKLPKYLAGKDRSCLPALAKVLGIPNTLAGD
jgi:prophage antirepressor-like protein